MQYCEIESPKGSHLQGSKPKYNYAKDFGMQRIAKHPPTFQNDIARLASQIQVLLALLTINGCARDVKQARTQPLGEI